MERCYANSHDAAAGMFIVSGHWDDELVLTYESVTDTSLPALTVRYVRSNGQLRRCMRYR